jgi:hypothetical protein
MLLGPVVSGLVLVAVAVPAHAAPATELITPIAPSGFTPVAVPGSPDGSFDLDQMARMAGVDKPAGLDAVGWDGAMRMWSGPGGQAAVVMAGRTKDRSTAQDAAAGALAGALDADGAGTFPSSLPGVDGAVATKGAGRAEFVAWSQGRYFAIAVTVTTGDDTHALIGDLVTHESDFLRTHFGVEPSANAAADSGTDPKLVGAAVVLLVALAAVVVWLVRRNRPTTEPASPFAFAAPPAPGTATVSFGDDVAFAPPPPTPAAPRPPPAPIPFTREPKAAPAPVATAPAPAPVPPRAPSPSPAPPAEPDRLANWDDRF